MRILRTLSKQVNIVYYNQIPLAKLTSGKNLERIKTVFGFNSAEVSRDANTGDVLLVQFRYGTFTTADGKDIAVDGLVLEERRILIHIEGPSSAADEIYEGVKRLLADLTEYRGLDYLRPIVKAEESEIIAALDFPVSCLIGPKYLHFVQERLPRETSSEQADAFVYPATLNFLIDFTVKDQSLNEHRISLNRKEFSVQPAIGHTIDERVYYSKAPLDTKTHVKVLEDLENLISRSE